MKTEIYQQTFARICLAAEVPDDAVTSLGGDPSRWHLYRQMVRSRLRRSAADGLPRTAALLNARGAKGAGIEGHASFRALFSEFLADRAPTSRFIRDIVLELDDYIQSHIEDAFVRDLSRYERAKWEVRDMPGVVPADCRSFDFDSAPVMNPVSLTFRVSHPVWRPDCDESARLDASRMVVACRLPDDSVATVVVPPALIPVVEAWRRTESTATEAVQALGRSGKLEVTPEFIGTLVEHLATWIERGLVLGSRA